MNTKIIQNATQTAINAAIKQSPKILTIVGIGGFFTTVMFAVKAKPKADLLIDEAVEIKKTETGDPEAKLTLWETVKVVAPAFWPTATMFVLSAAAVIASDVISDKRQTALTVAYTLADQGLKEYQNKITETMGQKKRDEIDQAIAQDQVNNNPPPSNSMIYTVNDDKLTDFRDPYSGRYFRADLEQVKALVNRINDQLNRGDDIMLNDIYYQLDKISIGDLSENDFGANHGWRYDDGIIDFNPLAVIMPNGKPCLVLKFEPAPAFLGWT